MTAQRQLKSIIRDRQARTGESYTAARVHVMRDRAALLGLAVEGAARADAVVSGSTTARRGSGSWARISRSCSGRVTRGTSSPATW